MVRAITGTGNAEASRLMYNRGDFKSGPRIESYPPRQKIKTLSVTTRFSTPSLLKCARSILQFDIK